MRLHGNDIDETTTALEADLGWIVGWKKDDFIGADVLRAAEGRRRRAQAGRVRDGRPRHRAPRLRRATPAAARQAGRHVTSGTQTPFLKKAIGMAYVPVAHSRAGTEFDVDIRGRRDPRARGADAVLQAPETRQRQHEETTMAYPDRLQVHQGPRVDRVVGRPRQGRHHRLRAAAARRRRVRRAAGGRREAEAGQSFGTIESVKAVSELYAPVSGEVVEVNAALKDKPEAVNTDPHGSWMIVIKLSDPAETRRRCSTRRSTQTLVEVSRCFEPGALPVPPHRPGRDRAPTRC